MGQKHDILQDNEMLFTLLRYGLDTSGECMAGLSLTDDKWRELIRLSRAQKVMGVLLVGCSRMPREYYPSEQIYSDWVSVMGLMQQRNRVLNDRCRRLTGILESVGLDSCVLKGQGVARLYPEPLFRQCGDIDILVRVHGGDKRVDEREVCRRLKSTGIGSLGSLVYHHVAWDLPGVDVEVHFRLMQFNSPFANRNLQRWCRRVWEGREKHDGYFCPSAEFNIIYLLAHMYHHLLFEGLLLKQVCDYYVLLASHGPCGNMDCTLRSLGMTRFAGGVMWIMQHLFHLERSRMITSPDESEGRFMLQEIMQAGGRKPKRASVAVTFWRRTRYRSRFLLHYPAEVLWDIPFRLYHWVWRRVVKPPGSV